MHVHMTSLDSDSASANIFGKTNYILNLHVYFCTHVVLGHDWLHEVNNNIMHVMCIWYVLNMSTMQACSLHHDLC
jgi:hypothetical protein